ncbi:MAG: GNAT family N-acetyltransferase [Pseudomonadota bacterium]|nr:GNAT family N-acetyltransferase [Pseudomonadota bacterium]
MTYELVEYCERWRDQWDDFIENAQGTVLQTRGFLDYHGERFAEQSILVKNEKNKIIAVFPAASALDDFETVISHPGATFGGFVTNFRPNPQVIEDIFKQVINHYRRSGFLNMQYISAPSYATRHQDQSDLFVLRKLNANFIACGLWSVVNLKQPRPRKKTLASSIRKAVQHGVKAEVIEDAESYKNFYALLTENLKDRHNSYPTHSFKEFTNLAQRLEDKSKLILAYSKNMSLLAGVWLINYSPGVWHTQYIASNQQGRELNATHFLIDDIIEILRKNGETHLSLGTSNNPGGDVDNQLFHFKSGFGGDAVTNWKVVLSLKERLI